MTNSREVRDRVRREEAEAEFAGKVLKKYRRGRISCAIQEVPGRSAEKRGLETCERLGRSELAGEEKGT